MTHGVVVVVESQPVVIPRARFSSSGKREWVGKVVGMEGGGGARGVTRERVKIGRTGRESPPRL